MKDDPGSKTREIDRRLRVHYGERKWNSSGDPVSELVATILSQNTSDVNSMRAFASLKNRYPTWERVIAAPVNDLTDTIRGGGLANIKAPRIQTALRELFAEHPDGDLSALRADSIDDARAALTRLPGVGLKTASCVLLFSLGMPAMPVDTHIHRVATRTGMVPPGTSADAAHAILEDQLDGTLQTAYTFHLNCIEHGREICRARTPLCSICPLQDICDYYRETNRDRTDQVSETHPGVICAGQTVARSSRANVRQHRPASAWQD